ncbi:hypothetical protein J2T57_001488 [Natronocella acetinitrilica]|uniref:Uncharacterized protein n=1 Tax=Natronocella acetinitrilica TaxID=414046 RepID=A0AAE3G259_9GAMM|nr:hypothetical protein [Natronocella acetinitrilica]MCP1674386.1 hypothetical protein [Natronocella acetinitrilica]
MSDWTLERLSRANAAVLEHSKEVVLREGDLEHLIVWIEPAAIGSMLALAFPVPAGDDDRTKLGLMLRALCREAGTPAASVSMSAWQSTSPDYIASGGRPSDDPDRAEVLVVSTEHTTLGTHTRSVLMHRDPQNWHDVRFGAVTDMPPDGISGNVQGRFQGLLTDHSVPLDDEIKAWAKKALAALIAEYHRSSEAQPDDAGPGLH